jgi:hypothetical protein
MVFNTTFNNISVISWRSVLLVEETGENYRLDKSYKLWGIILYEVTSEFIFSIDQSVMSVVNL